MSVELWLSFAVASLVLLSIPGPTVLLVVSYALSGGKKTAFATVPGVTLGDFTAMTISLAGAGAVLAASATLFTVMKVAGALYLIWLGIGMWRDGGGLSDPVAESSGKSYRSMFLNSFVVTALNPKGIVFFVAFVPQFINPAEPVFIQFAILEATFLAFAAINIVIWVMLAGSLRSQFKRPGAMKLVKRLGGSCLMGAGALTALVQRN
ncbi:MAG: LysE family translocator [Sneathiellales bacterium]|nr:LysE family translocator [Sneathiellales bacterium]